MSLFLILFTVLTLCDRCYGFNFAISRIAFASSKTAASQHYVLMQSSDEIILRQVDKWACIRNCGACCKLGPLESRPDLDEYLDPEELKTYKSMIGPDDWCVNFDKKTRMCNIYDTRPDFCRVDPAKYKKMFKIEEEDFNDFCAFCCREQIGDVYGENSSVMLKFEEVIAQLNDDDDGSYDNNDLEEDLDEIK